MGYALIFLQRFHHHRPDGGSQVQRAENQHTMFPGGSQRQPGGFLAVGAYGDIPAYPAGQLGKFLRGITAGVGHRGDDHAGAVGSHHPQHRQAVFIPQHAHHRRQVVQAQRLDGIAEGAAAVGVVGAVQQHRGGLPQQFQPGRGMKISWPR